MNGNFKLYKTLIVIFSCFIFSLVFLNFNVLRSINSRRSLSVNSNMVAKIPENKYGYTDILKIIGEDTNLRVKSIESISDNGGSIKLNLTYAGNLEELYSCLEKLKTQPCLFSIGDIKINKKENNNDISFVAIFLKTK